MEAKLLKTTQAEYVEGQYSGKNESGYRPVGERILVLPDTGAERSSGGVFIPETVTEQQSYAAETGIIIEIGDGAFTWNADRTRPFAGTKPKPGDRVFFDRYSGGVMKGKDGRLYRTMDDKAIGAVSA
jgi:chaperonin GroES